LAELRAIEDGTDGFVDGGAPRLQPLGTSMHYLGTTRMGLVDDGHSVCGPTGAVWGHPTVFVVGNGVIDTATACNPTLTSVAYALLTADARQLLA